MVKANTYTQAADIWSAGILLFAIVAGHLPFDDDNIQRLLQKIVYTEVRYPSFMAPQLVDLLQKMICRDPDRRIPVDMIKNHPWFSQSEYIVSGPWEMDLLLGFHAELLIGFDIENMSAVRSLGKERSSNDGTV
jgi:serine/threonine protein kinase